jgi:acetylornithine deacetylase/succinyl-diaminopimelate desuccinylase
MKRDLAALVAIDTQNPPGREIEAARFLRDLLAGDGFDVALSEYEPGRANVVARLENGGGKVFAFNTHMDVVPVGDGWASDPMKLREADGRLYGRGACDCKGPLAAMLEAMRMLAADRQSWSGTLLGVFVGDEEVASAGARSFTAARPRIDYAVVGEPTSNATVIAHKGSLRPLVRVHGKSAHSGAPHLGDNAIYRAAALTKLIEAYQQELMRRVPHRLVGTASVTVTRMIAGEADNVVPAVCDILIDRRMVPGEDGEAVKAELAGLLSSARERFGIRAEIVSYRPTTGNATETPVGSPVVAAGLAACRAHGRGDPGPFGFQGGCDLVHFRATGADGVVIGPGARYSAHKPDEFVPTDEFAAASLIYRDVAKSMLERA